MQVSAESQCLRPQTRLLQIITTFYLLDGVPTIRALTSLDIRANDIGQLFVEDPELMKQQGVTYEEAESGKMLYWDKDDKCLGEECPAHCLTSIEAMCVSRGIALEK